MRKVVLTVKDEICRANGKDVNATELLTVMTHYGTVEDYEKAVGTTVAEYQTTIDSLNTQYAAIADQKLTEDEIKLINSYRQLKGALKQTYEAENTALKNQLQAEKSIHENCLRQIAAILGK